MEKMGRKSKTVIPCFLNTVKVELIPNSDPPRWRLTEDLKYVTSHFWEGRLIGLIEVPDGFETDFASVPRLPVVWLLAGDTAHQPAVVHDWLYVNRKFSRSTADAIFAEAMATIGVPLWRRAAMWLAVRIFGYGAWK